MDHFIEEGEILDDDYENTAVPGSVPSDEDLSEDTEDEDYERAVRLLGDPSLFCPCCEKALRDPVELHCGHVMERRCANSARQLGLVLSCPACGARQYCADANQLSSAHGGALVKRLPVPPETRWRLATTHSSDSPMDKRTKTKVRDQRRRRRNKKQRAKERRREQLAALDDDDYVDDDDDDDTGLVPPKPKMAKPALKLPDTSVPPPGMMPFPSQVIAPSTTPTYNAPVGQTIDQMQTMLSTMQNMMLQPGAANNPQLMSMMQQMMQMVQQQQQLEALQIQRGLAVQNVSATALGNNGVAYTSKASTSTSIEKESNYTPLSCDPQQSAVHGAAVVQQQQQQQEMETMYMKALSLYQQGNAAPWSLTTDMTHAMSQMQALYAHMFQYPQSSSIMEAYTAQYMQAMQNMMAGMTAPIPPPTTMQPPPPPPSTTVEDCKKNSGSSSASASAFSDLYSSKTELQFPSLGLEIPQFVPQTPRYVESSSDRDELGSFAPQSKVANARLSDVAQFRAPLTAPTVASVNTKVSKTTPLTVVSADAPLFRAPAITSSVASANTRSSEVTQVRAPRVNSDLSLSNTQLGSASLISSSTVEASSQKLTESRHLLLSGLPNGIKAADVKQLLSCFGRVNNIKVVLRNGTENQPSLLMAYVTMEAGSVAQDAVQRLDLQLFRGTILRAKQLLNNPFVKDIVP